MKFKTMSTACVLAVTLAAIGCRQPATDIVAISTEDVGDYSMRASRDGGVLKAMVCVARPARAGMVADRILHQLYSRGLTRATLDIYSESGGVVRVDWNAGVRREEPLAGAPPGAGCGRAHSSKEPS
jgi:hypothetical protein